MLSTLLFGLMLLMLDVGLRYMYEGCGITAWTSVVPLTFTLAWVVGLTAATHLLPRLARRIACGVTGGLYLILFLVHAVMGYAKSTFFSFSTLIFAADGLKFLDPEYFRVRKLVWLTLAAGICALVLSILLAPKVQRSKRRWIADCLVTAALVGGAIWTVNQNRVKNLSDRVTIHFDGTQASLIYENFSDANESLMLSGLYQYSFRDFCMTYGVYDLFHRISDQDAVQALEDWYDNKEIDPDNAYTGIYRDKNLLLIQLEAIDTWMIDETFMPNLWAIQQKSVDFVNHFTPLYLDAGTFNTEMIVNTGLVSPFTGSRASMYSHNAYPDSLAHLMTEAGYTARSFHRSDGSVYNRAEIHENWGYEHYYDGEEMGMARLDFDEDMMAAYDTMTSGKFLSFLITYSAHGPYVGSAVSAEYYDWAAGLLPEGADEMLIHAYAHAYATDRFIGALMDRLEADGLLENTVLVFYSDHYDYYVLDNDLICREKGVDDLNMITRTPFFLYEAHTQPCKIEKVTSSYDVLPTLVNLFGLDCDGRYYVGNDIFSDNGGYAIFADYSWYDGTTYWNTMAGDSPTETVAARNAEIQTRLRMSWDTMKLNYLAARKEPLRRSK